MNSDNLCRGSPELYILKLQRVGRPLYGSSVLEGLSGHLKAQSKARKSSDRAVWGDGFVTLSVLVVGEFRASFR